MIEGRGIATLFVDQEGTGEAIRYHRIAKRHDTEVSAGKFHDALARHPSIDKDRIGLIGLSMGGYCAPRAAAMDHRFKCVACIGAFFELDAAWEAILRGRTQSGLSDGLPQSGLHAMHVTRTRNIDDAIAVMKSRTLEPVIDRITWPLLVVHGENDRAGRARPRAHDRGGRGEQPGRGTPRLHVDGGLSFRQSLSRNPLKFR